MKVVVIRLGAVGDVVLTLGVLASLRTEVPAAQITFVTRPALGPLVVSHPAVDDIMLTPNEESVFHLARRIRRLRPEIIIDLHGKLRAILLKVMCGAKHHVIWQGRPNVARIRHQLGGARAHPTGLQTEASYRAAEKAIGRPLVRKKPAIYVGALDEAVAAKIWEEVRVSRSGHSVVVLSPGAQWATKRWPLAHFATLARALVGAGHGVVVVGNSAELPLAKAICSEVPQALSLAGRLGLGPLASFLKRTSLMICGDTGPLHIARAVGCRTLGLFGSTSPDAFAAEGDKFLAESIDCAPCTFYGKARCPLGTMRCLEDLSPERVAKTALELLAKFSPSSI